MARATRAESVIPRMVNPAKTRSTTAVASMGGRIGTRVLKYSTAVLAEITAVARYDRRVRQAANEASNFRVQLSRQL